MTVAAAALARYLIVCYGVLVLLAVAARLLPVMSGAMLGFAIVVLALPAMGGLWHRSALRRIERLHRFAPDRWLGRWASKRVLAQVGGALVAVVLAAAVLLQSPFFGPAEWVLLAVAPLAFLGWERVMRSRVGPLFSREVYATSGAMRLACALTFASLCVAWLAARYVLSSGDGRPLGELVHALQSTWPQVQSGTARWALDMGAWGQAVLAMGEGEPSASWWRVPLALVVLPLTVFAFVTWSAAGASLDVAAWRRMLGAALTDADAPPALSTPRLRAYGVGGALITGAFVLLFARVDAWLGQQERFLAVAALPQCERVGGRMYSMGTLAKVRTYTSVIDEAITTRRAAACARIADVRSVAARNVDAYLDWYFSLAGDWTRFALVFSGDVESLLEVKFNKLVAADPRVAARIDELRLDQQHLLDAAWNGRNVVTDMLEQQRLVVDERQCKIVADETNGIPALPRYDGVRTRMVASAATGVVAGAFASTLTATAMRRASMAAAGRVLGKAAAKRGAGAFASGAVAGGVGGSVVPGVGTAAGIVAGAAMGLATDVAMLAVEEKLTREDMRRDLLAALDDSLATLRGAFDCPGK